MLDPNLFSVPVWKGHEKSLAIQTRKAKATESSTEARRCYLSQPNGEPCARVDCPDGGLPYKQRYKYATVFVGQASQMGFVYLQMTHLAEETIEAKRALEKYAVNQESGPRGQWNLQSKEVDGRMPSAKTKFDLCWRQHSPSKRHSRTKNPQAPRDDQGNAYTRIKTVAGSGNNPSLAVCHANGKPSLQLNTALVTHRQTKSKQNL